MFHFLNWTSLTDPAFDTDFYWLNTEQLLLGTFLIDDRQSTTCNMIKQICSAGVS